MSEAPQISNQPQVQFAEASPSVEDPDDEQLNQFPMLNGPQRVVETSSSSTAPSVRRNKVKLAPGHSAMDWNRLKATTDLRGVPAIKRYTVEELYQHRTQEDCWIALSGKVYNVTQYMHYHPGGRYQLMRGAGKDATELFMKVHSWVNYEYLLDKCHVGYLLPAEKSAAASGLSPFAVPENKLKVSSPSASASSSSQSVADID